MNKKHFFMLAVGLILAIGTAGASDLNAISNSQLYIQIFLSLVLMACGYARIRKNGQKENSSGTRNTEAARIYIAKCKEEHTPPKRLRSVNLIVSRQFKKCKEEFDVRILR